MSLAFRQRIFGFLVLVSAVPAAVAIAVALLSRGMEAPVGGAAAWERIGASWQTTRQLVDTSALDSARRRAVARFEQELSTSLRRSRQAQQIRTAFRSIVAVSAIMVAVLVGGGMLYLAGHLSRQLSRPIDELVEWTSRLQRGEPLPTAPTARGAPEFDLLRRAFRGAEIELERSRRRDVQAAELRAFRDMARQVAHELKNPLTPMRFAIAKLAADAPAEKKELVEILAAESARLERMARDFGDLGRLPEGPMATVDLRELFEELLRTVPEETNVALDADPGSAIQGHYEMLRRAFANLVLNALDAMTEDRGPRTEKALSIAIRPAMLNAQPGVEVVIRDSGPGIPAESLAKVFEPYFTTKSGGTGLGLAIVRQTIHHHGGTISAGNAGRGAVFTVFLPKGAA